MRFVNCFVTPVRGDSLVGMSNPLAHLAEQIAGRIVDRTNVNLGHMTPSEYREKWGNDPSQQVQGR